MNAKSKRSGKYIKFVLYAAVVVLLNVAGITLFFRGDLTKNGIYSLSSVSEKVVATLTEPMTVKVFFTKDLPAPYNNVELYLRDLLNEYAMNNKKQFRVHFYNVSAENEGVTEDARLNQQMAREYGIQPVQIQNVEQDEIKFKQAYMGMVLIHGDIVERIPTITATDGLEYKLTTAIQKLNQKVSALLALDDKIHVKVLLSSSFARVAPYIGLKGLDQYPEEIKGVVERLNTKTYGRLAYEFIDPTLKPDAVKDTDTLAAMRYSWQEIPDAKIEAGKGIIGMLMQYKDQSMEIPLLRVVRLPIFGDQYQLASTEQIEEMIGTNLDRMININQEIGYLADFGTLEAAAGGPLGPRGDTAANFTELLNKTYNVKYISLKEDPIPQGLKCLIVAGPKEKFSDYALYQIDQAVMHGTNLALFVDALQEQADNQGLMMGNQQMRFHVPLDTGLEKMLAHYGVRIKNAVVMDKECFRQRKPPQQGGGEQPIYFIPRIENEYIAKDLDYMKNIKGLYGFINSPLELDDKQIGEQKITAHKLFSSSDRSWEMRDRIMLSNPMFITPPGSDSEMASRPLAYMLEGNFTSYFKGKPMPEKPAPGEEKDAEGQEATAEKKTDATQIQGQGTFRETSPPVKIFVVASSKMIGDQLIDEEGQSPNTVFALNIIDALNNRADVAAMRSKDQRLNPLSPIGTGSKFAIKTANIVGLPILVVVFGLIVWGRRHVRKKNIQAMFQR